MQSISFKSLAVRYGHLHFFHCAGGTFALLKSFLPAKCGISTTFVDIADLDAVKASITDKTKVRVPRIYRHFLSLSMLLITDSS